ncbi:MAG: hypothetical protein RL104_984, partial [Bacteroidota bacterium]
MVFAKCDGFSKELLCDGLEGRRIVADHELVGRC